MRTRTPISTSALGAFLVLGLMTGSPAWAAVSASPSVADTVPLPSFSSKQVLLLMGTRFEFGAEATTQAQADSAVAVGIREVQRVEAVISSWQPTSETSRVNRRAADTAVVVSQELYGLLDRSLKISAVTNYAFDIAAGGLNRLYRFGGQDTTLPDASRLASARSVLGKGQVVLNPEQRTVRFTTPGVRIGFGAIGKGYAANRARQVMRQLEGVTGGVVNAAGDLATFGTPSGQAERWTIGIADPRNPGRWLGQVEVAEAAVVTSGDYEKYFTVGDQRYAHIIDPRTALPTTAVRSATVVCPDAEVADALATSVFVLGVEKGIALLNSLTYVEGLLVDDAGEVHTSSGLLLQPYTPTQ